MGSAPVNSPMQLEERVVGQPPGLAMGLSEQVRQPFARFAVFIVVLTVCFAKPIYDLARLALKSELYSHVLLVPVISLYLGWLRRGCIPLGRVRRSWASA